MPLEIVTVPCLSDNYAFLIHDPVSDKTALVDAPEAAPISVALNARGWELDEIWLTHHHGDHIAGVAALKGEFGASVTGAKADRHRLPPLDRAVAEGDTFTFAGEAVRVFDVSGHTIGHIAFYLPGVGAAFTADSLMACGCGRVFEGTMEQMWQSLSKLAELPPETLVYSGHEYTSTNAAFALTIEPDSAALRQRAHDISAAHARGEPTVPSALALELATNPFLRASDSDVKASLGLENAPDAEVFGEIRRRKDAF